MLKKNIENQTKRISSKDFKLYIYKNKKWILHYEKIPTKIKDIILRYKKNNSLNHLIDEHNLDFLKGSLNSKNIPCGKRIKHMPNGKKLARAGFSIFAKNLGINEKNKPLWDVVYENTSGSKTYLYDEDKVHLEHEKKARIVNKFTKNYRTIIENLEKDVKKKQNNVCLALWIMLKTFIRVGNLEYYNYLGHKGLTTLQKKDIKIKKNLVIFDFIGKDGVEQHIEKEFENFAINKLKKLLDKKQNNDFVFTDSKKIPLHSQEFSKILFDYTGEHFYPHIIRSYHADSLCKEFISKHKKGATKKEVEQKFTQIAKDLGHKKYNKKKNIWEINYKVTINNYIRPKYSQKMISLYE